MQMEQSRRNRAMTVLTLFPGKSGKDDGQKWLPVRIHALDTKAAMERLLNNWVPERVKQSLRAVERLSDVCAFLALVHDIGKLTPAFLELILPHLPELNERLIGAGLSTDCLHGHSSIRHATAGAAILTQLSCPAGIAAVVGAHHGKPISEEDECNLCDHMKIYSAAYYGADGMDSEQGRLWAEVRRLWFNEALQMAGFGSVDELPELDLRAQMLLTGLLIAADWVASNADYFPLLDLEDTGEGLDMERRAALAWERFDPRDPWKPSLVVPDESWFRGIFDFAPNQEQRATVRAAENSWVPGIFILEAQMGRGKTEAALAAAEVLAGKLNCGGIFFGLPTQATANGVFSRLKTWGERQAEDMDLTIRLAHGNAALNEEYRALFDGASDVDAYGDGGLVVHPWFKGRKKALLSDFVIGTIDQFLMAGLKQRHLMLRHLGLAGKVVILDECHAYDAYMNQYLDRVLNWMGAYGTPVIVLSATLPAERRARMIDAYRNVDSGTEKNETWRTSRGYPLLTWTQGETVHQEVIPQDTPSREVTVGRLAEEDLADWLKDRLSQGGCAGVIVNTVRRAQEMAGKLQAALPNARVELFHSQFLMPDRAEKESRLVGQIGKGSTAETRDYRIVVGTQVLEQSLDIDFDCMAIDLCPMDLLLQRIGRLHRHRRTDRPEKLRKPVCMVMGAEEALDEGSKAVYGEWLLLRTRELLPDSLLLPDSIPTLVQSTYDEPREEELDGKREAWERYKNDIKGKESRAKTCRIRKPISKKRKIQTINGWLDAEILGDARGEAKVRDSEAAIQVLLMRYHRENGVTFMPWSNVKEVLSPYRVPEAAMARYIAMQRISLPRIFSSWDRAEKTIRELEDNNASRISVWRRSEWLRDELFLLLDENNRCHLGGYVISYGREMGLQYWKEAENEEQ